MVCLKGLLRRRTLRPSAAIALFLALIPGPVLSAQADARASTPAGGQSIPWSQLGAEASKQASGDALSVRLVEPGQARLETRFQRLAATVTAAEGLWLNSTAERPAGEKEAGRFRVLAHAVGRDEGGLTPIPRQGQVTVAEGRVRWARPGLVEEYSVSVDGLRQDFLLAQRPAGAAPLRLELAVDGARAEAAEYGARLRLADGRQLAYAKLHVEDARGQVLAARMEVAASDRIALVIDDARATYPLRVDPTFSDAHWISMGGFGDTNGTVTALAVDAGGVLYAGGVFTKAGGVEVNRIARWDGSAWSALGGGMNGIVEALALDADGTLYAGGSFTVAGGEPVDRIARWDGSAWSALGGGMNGTVWALALDADGTLYAGGSFTVAGGEPVDRIARWNGSEWSSLGVGVNGQVNALVLDDSGRLYVGGGFTEAGGNPANRIARWDDGGWSALGGGMNNLVHALALDASGQLYAGGTFTTADSVTVNRIARWDGSEWSALGGGTTNPVLALALDASGQLYAGGAFTTAGGVTVNRIARWDGGNWSALGSGVSGGVLPSVHALAVDASGYLYAGGLFTTAGGKASANLAKADIRVAVAYDGNGATAGTAPASHLVGPGALVTAPGNTGGLTRPGYSFSGWNTAADGSGDTYAPGSSFKAGREDMTLYAHWSAIYTVSTSAGPGGGISPTSRNVTHGDSVDFNLLPQPGYVVVGASGCGGTLSGETYTTGPITAPCTVSASFELAQYAVAAVAGPGGQISPPSRSVTHGERASFSLLPQPGYVVVAASGCGGSLMGLTYTTGPITAPCAVSASFGPAQYVVEASAGPGGRINPAHQWVTHGGSASFSVTPDSGFSIAMVSGCGGSLSGNTYTTGSITSPCSVLASFSRNRYQVSTQVSAGGRLSPESQLVDHGERASFSVSVDDGYRLERIDGCGGSLEGETYTTGAVTGACTVSAAFAFELPAFGVIEPVSLNATGLFTPLPELDPPPAHDRHGNVLAPTLLGAKSHYAPGRHTLTWRAEDAEGRVATAEQRLDVWPQVSLSQDLRLGYNASGSFQILLNGPAPEYPFTVSYGVGGSAQVGVDHALVAGSVTFTGGTEVSVPLQTLAGSGVDTELVVSLEPGVNLGARQQLVATLLAHNVAAHVEVRAWQGGRPVVAVARDGGPVSLVATVTDPNPQDTHQGEWTVPAESVVSTGPNGLSLGVNPQSLNLGLQAFELTVTDSGTPAAVTVVSLPLNVSESAPLLGGGDSNGNGIPDNVEGDGDSNGNGIPDYQDGGLAANLLPSEGGVFDRFLLEAEPGLRLGLGAYAIGQGLGGSRLVHPEALPQADSVTSAGGYFDFLVSGLPEPGRSVRVVVPQQAPVPAGAVYRKYAPSRGEWFDFVEDGRNGLASAPGDQGYCPPPGDMSYSPGLTEGHWCVQLTLEDGGSNDADGVANGEVRDPGGVTVAAAEEPVPERRGGGGGADLALLLLGLLGVAGLRYRRAYIP